MSQEDTNGDAGGQGLDVQLAQELLQRARQEDVSLIGPDGLLAGVTRTVLADRLGCRDDQAPRVCQRRLDRADHRITLN